MRGRRKLVDIAAPQVGAADDQTSTLQRLAIMFNRWQEDRSVLLANPCEPFDELKYRDPEGFVAARVLVEGLRRAGKALVQIRRGSRDRRRGGASAGRLCRA
jgi:hypothetical protein